MERCKACGDGVLVNTSRRTLDAVSRNVLLFISNTLDFPEATLHFGSGYLCTPCWRLAGRYERLKRELYNVEESIKNKLQFVRINQNSGEVSRATKRPSSEANPRSKKARLETSEGAVMVSIILSKLKLTIM